MIDMMLVVEKGWNKTESNSKVVTPSDEAFGIFYWNIILTIYLLLMC